MNGRAPEVSRADAQFPQTPAEGVGLFHLAGRDHVEEGLVKHALVLPEMVHLILRRLDRQELFHGAVVPEGVVRDGSGEHCQHRIAKERSRLQALVHRVLWPIHRVSKKAVVSAISRMVRDEPLLRRQSHIFLIPHDLDGELGFSMFISKDAEGHVLQEATSVRVLVYPRVTSFCGVYSHGSRGRDRNRHGTWTQ